MLNALRTKQWTIGFLPRSSFPARLESCRGLYGLARHLLPNLIKEVKHCQPQCIGNDLYSINRRIRPPILNPAQVRLVEAAPFPELDLAQASLNALCAYAFAKLFGKLRSHIANCPRYALIHINTNSYNREAQWLIAM